MSYIFTANVFVAKLILLLLLKLDINSYAHTYKQILCILIFNAVSKYLTIYHVYKKLIIMIHFYNKSSTPDVLSTSADLFKKQLKSYARNSAFKLYCEMLII